MGRVVSPTPTILSSRRVGPALVASYNMAVGLFYTQPTGQVEWIGVMKLIWFCFAYIT